MDNTKATRNPTNTPIIEMNNPSNLAQSFVLPKLCALIRIAPDDETGDGHLFWDIKFFPYSSSDAQTSIFAAVDQETVHICEILGEEDQLVRVLHSIHAPDATEQESSEYFNSCSWACIDAAQPLLVVAGDSGQLRVFDALAGSLFTTLVGHGLGTVNDLSTHPIYPWIVASASMDSSVRIWDLRRWNSPHESPCVVICGHGMAHKEGILTVSWHDNGRYMISGGHDHRVCVWVIPDLHPDSTFWTEISPAGRKRSSAEVRVIYYPHFISSAVHSNYVDCIRFYGDFIVSKAAEEFKIVLWTITGFNSKLPPPSDETAPKTSEHLETRSGFVRTIRRSEDGIQTIEIAEHFKEQPLYQRLIEFGAPHSQPFYMRFGLLKPTSLYPHVHPILACGNTRSQVYFWDLERLELGHDGGLNDIPVERFRVPAKKKKTTTVKPNPLDRVGRAINGQFSSPGNLEPPSSPSSSRRSSSIGTFDSAAFARQGSTDASSHTSEHVAVTDGPVVDRIKYPINNPHKPIKPHKEIPLGEFNSKLAYFTARAVDWSPCGRWCAVAGEAGGTAGIALFEKSYL